jgi:hypothetical protein
MSDGLLRPEEPSVIPDYLGHTCLLDPLHTEFFKQNDSEGLRVPA